MYENDIKASLIWNWRAGGDDDMTNTQPHTLIVLLYTGDNEMTNTHELLINEDKLTILFSFFYLYDEWDH